MKYTCSPPSAWFIITSRLKGRQPVSILPPLVWLFYCLIACWPTSTIGATLPHGGDAILTLNIIEQTVAKKPHQTSKSVNPGAPQGGQITLAHIGSYHHHNPFKQLGKASKESLYQFDSLLMPAPDQNAVYYGLLAQDITLHQDRKSMVITLQPHAQFADGSPVTAEDVKASIEKIMQHGPWHYHTLQQYQAQISVKGPHTLTITLPKPCNIDTLIAFGHVPIGKKSTLSSSLPIGSGPYQLTNTSISATSSFTKNPTYWAQNLPQLQGLYNFATLKTVYYRNQHAAFEGFKRHEYDYKVEYYLENWHSLTSWQTHTPALHTLEIPQEKPIHMQGLVFNQQRDLWQDQTVRQALLDCFDFTTINTYIFQSQYQRIPSYFTNTPYQSTNKTPPSPANQQALKKLDQLLNQKGWVIDQHLRVHQHTHEPLVIKLLLPNKHNEKIASIFAKNLAQLGIQTHILTHEGSQYIHSFREGHYDLAYTHLEHNPLSVNSLKNVWTPTKNSYNLASLAHINDTHLLDLLEKLSPPVTNTQKTSMLQDLDTYLLQQAYIIPFWYQDHERVAYWHSLQIPENYHPKSAWLTLWQADTHTN